MNHQLLKKIEDLGGMMNALESQLSDANKKIAVLGTQLDEAQARAADADRDYQVNESMIVCDVVG